MLSYFLSSAPYILVVTRPLLGAGRYVVTKSALMPPLVKNTEDLLRSNNLDYGRLQEPWSRFLGNCNGDSNAIIPRGTESPSTEDKCAGALLWHLRRYGVLLTCIPRADTALGAVSVQELRDLEKKKRDN